MKKTQWIILIVFILLALTVITLNVLKNSKSDSSGKPVIKVGVVLPLSGNIADAGQAALASLDLELAELKKQNLKYDYKLVVEDVQLSLKTTAMATNKLILVDKVSAIVSIWSALGNVVVPIAEKNKVISLACAYGEESARGKYTFNFMPDMEKVADFSADALKKRGVKTVALFIENAGGTLEIRDHLLKSFSEKGIKLTSDEVVVFGEKNYKIALIKAMRHNPDMYFIVGAPPAPYLFVRQLRELSGKSVTNITTIDGYYEMSAEQRPIAEGMWYIDTSTNGTTEFQNRLQSAKGIEPLSCSGTSAGNLKILVTAYEKASVQPGEQTPTTTAVTEWIRANIKDFETPVGKTTLVKNGMFDMQSQIRIIKNGQPVLLED